MATDQPGAGLPPIVVYSGPLCSGCAEVKAYLHQQGIAYEERNIRADMPTMIEFRRKGYEILPVIELGAQVIQDYESLAQLETALRATGYLR
ncbi:MAG TPA: glutaredoxin family protein [Chloroflexia bacterium]|nr:glutaredoxin family protein [Chloroflexia bacterium]